MQIEQPGEEFNTYHVVVAKTDHSQLKAKAALEMRSLRETYSDALATLLGRVATMRDVQVPRHELPPPIKEQTCRVNLHLPAQMWDQIQELREQTRTRNLDLIHAAVLMTV